MATHLGKSSDVCSGLSEYYSHGVNSRTGIYNDATGNFFLSVPQLKWTHMWGSDKQPYVYSKYMHRLVQVEGIVIDTLVDPTRRGTPCTCTSLWWEEAICAFDGVFNCSTCKMTYRPHVRMLPVIWMFQMFLFRSKSLVWNKINRLSEKLKMWPCSPLRHCMWCWAIQINLTRLIDFPGSMFNMRQAVYNPYYAIKHAQMHTHIYTSGVHIMHSFTIIPHVTWSWPSL